VVNSPAEVKSLSLLGLGGVAPTSPKKVTRGRKIKTDQGLSAFFLGLSERGALKSEGKEKNGRRAGSHQRDAKNRAEAGCSEVSLLKRSAYGQPSEAGL